MEFSINNHQFIDVVSYVVLVSFVLILLNISRKPIKSKAVMPSGPCGLPILGYYPFIGNAHEEFTKLSNIYGDVFQINLLGRRFIILNSYESMKEAFVKQSDIFLGKPEGFRLLSYILENKGISVIE